MKLYLPLFLILLFCGYAYTGHYDIIQIPNIKVNLCNIQFISPANGWIVGDSGTLLYSQDSAKTWTSKPFNAKRILAGLKFTDSLTGIIWSGGYKKGESSHTWISIYKTSNQGNTWDSIACDFGDSINGTCMRFANNSIGWVTINYSNNQADIFGTIDGGNTWIKEVHLSADNELLKDNYATQIHFTSLSICDSNNCFATSYNYAGNPVASFNECWLFGTNNQGKNWNSKLTWGNKQPGQIICSYYLPNKYWYYDYEYSHCGQIVNDSGKTIFWLSPCASTTTIDYCLPISHDEGWIAVSRNDVLKSCDTCITFKYSPFLFHTINGGLYWDTVSLVDNAYNLVAGSVYDVNNAFFLFKDGIVYHFTDTRPLAIKNRPKIENRPKPFFNVIIKNGDISVHFSPCCTNTMEFSIVTSTGKVMLQTQITKGISHLNIPGARQLASGVYYAIVKDRLSVTKSTIMPFVVQK